MFRWMKVPLLLGIAIPAILPAQGGYARERRRANPNSPNLSAYKGVAGSFHGRLKDLGKKEIMIETDDNQTVSIRRTGKTRFLKGTQPIKPSDIDVETPVTVNAREDVDLKLTAIDVVVDSPSKNTSPK